MELVCNLQILIYLIGQINMYTGLQLPYIFFEIWNCRQKQESLDSSVGRAGDCRGQVQTSLGHWFESGSRDSFYQFSLSILCQYMIYLLWIIFKSNYHHFKLNLPSKECCYIACAYLLTSLHSSGQASFRGILSVHAVCSYIVCSSSHALYVVHWPSTSIRWYLTQVQNPCI